MTVQHPSQIDKGLRMMVQEYHTLVNHSLRKLLVFRQPDRISVVVSNESPEVRSKSGIQFPKFMSFDRLGIGGSFDTAAGAGVQGNGADIERKKSGLPFKFMIVLIVAVAFGLIGAARGMGWFTGKLLTGTVFSAKDDKGRPMPVAAPMFRPNEKPKETSAVISRSVASEEKVYMIMFAKLPGFPFLRDGVRCVGPSVVHVGLSDGSTYTVGDGFCSYADPRGCVINGQVFPVQVRKGSKHEIR